MKLCQFLKENVQISFKSVFLKSLVINYPTITFFHISYVRNNYIKTEVLLIQHVCINKIILACFQHTLKLLRS